MSSDQFDRERMIKAITAAKGKITLAALSLGCSRETIYQYAKKYATVQNAIVSARDDFDEEILDIAEHKLRQAVLDGEQWAIQYALNKKGKVRGYAERTEIANAPGETLRTQQTNVNIAAESAHDASNILKQLAELGAIPPATSQSNHDSPTE